MKTKTTALLKQGLIPRELTQCIIVTALISTIPIFGLSTFMITVSIKRKLNSPVILSISYLMWPLQILLIIPFIHLGEFIFSFPRNHHSVQEIIKSFQNSFFQTLIQFSFKLLCGLGSWLFTAVPIAIAIYGL